MLSQLSDMTMPAHAELRLPFSFYTVQQSIHIVYTNLWSITHPSSYIRRPTLATLSKTTSGDVSVKRLHAFGIAPIYAMTILPAKKLQAKSSQQ
jgi:hypothetical protein